MKIEEKILILRKQKGLSQEGLANRLNVTRQAVYKWEAGICLPELEKIKQMASLFGVTAEELINNEISLSDTSECNYEEYRESDTEPTSVEEKPKKSKKWLIPAIISAAALLIVISVVLGVIFYLQTQGSDGCQHEYGPWSINDVSHKRICKKCEDVFVEDHIYEDNICAVCNRIKIEETSGLSFVKVEGKEEYKLYSLGSAATKKPEQINIPSSYEGLPVTAIAANAFKGCDFVKKIYLPSTIKHLESYAMTGAGVTGASYYGVGYPTVKLYYQGSLEDWCNITVEANSIRRNSALYIDDLQVRDLVIPESITEVPKYTFNNLCFNTVTIGDHVTKICQGAFQFANIELKLNLGTGLEEISEGAFCYSDGVDQLFLPEGLKIIGKMAFCATDVKSLNIPNSVEYIGDGAFSICSYINFVHIGKGICYIGRGAFDGSDSNIHLFTVDAEGVFEMYDSNGEYIGNVDAELINEKPLTYMLLQNLYYTFAKEGYLK
ncbi:MAG: leucine-rich repeat protein [Clostridia bacterium]|nr:leucine-rich repeat protein [Clostridia bacterium]